MTDAAIQTTLSPTRNRAPSPKLMPIIGVLRAARKDPLQFFVRAAQEHGDVVRFNTGPQSLFLLNDPNHIDHVLSSNYQNYKKSKYYDRVKSIFGEGMFTVDGEVWRRKRQLVQPAFHHRKIEALCGVMTKVAEETVERWRPAAAQGEPIDLASEMMQISLSISIRAFMSVDYPLEVTPMARALTVLMRAGEKRIWSLFDFSQYLPTPSNFRVKRAVESFDRELFALLDERKEDGIERDDLLSMMLGVRDADTGEPLTNKQLRDELMTVITAGHETTAVTIAWAYYLLSKFPEVERKLHAELRTVLNGRTPTVSDLPNLPYTKMVAYETMRLYPPFWTMSRTAIEDDELGGYHIPSGSAIMLCPYVVHRNPKYWENPEGFDPERFTADREAARPRYAYFPFGGGPRVCIGKQFALMEAQLLLAVVSQHYRLHVVPGQRIEPEPMISLRPRDRMLMTVHPRA